MGTVSRRKLSTKIRVGSGSSLQDVFDELLMILRISVCVAGSKESIVDVAEGSMVSIGGHDRGSVVDSSLDKSFLMVLILQRTKLWKTFNKIWQTVMMLEGCIVHNTKKLLLFSCTFTNLIYETYQYICYLWHMKQSLNRCQIQYRDHFGEYCSQ